MKFNSPLVVRGEVREPCGKKRDKNAHYNHDALSMPGIPLFFGQENLEERQAEDDKSAMLVKQIQGFLQRAQSRRTATADGCVYIVV
jgi:hypothetical protein